MTDRRTATARTVTTLHRPPVRQSTLVRSDVQHTFEVFVREIGVWWPRQPYSAGGDRVRDVTVEPHVDGRVYETWDDGTVREWGRLLAFQRPHRFAMSWLATPAPTEVELTFTALGPALTRVAVEHRGWEALSAAQLDQDCAQPGGYAAGGFHRGWATILAALAGAASPTRTPTDDPREGERP
ncbi:SRPBCC domain-containing protein [Pseudonocardia humida]|uniref:SRPBCC domain-containing protein n=1 Tax=Pseudonocardia humida TaxID=2800819 RepID=A0ABT1A145_9PSEU|nr:SRPBCC domain-containing protein [Pseudonocardia humida]MCO1656707.1 SRPBCC domain-containing protein [Pseudonocardia humida]